MVNYTKLKLNGKLINTLKKRFIAFDTETTGLDAWSDRIIEVGAVLFEDGKPVKSYGSLIHSVDYVPYEAREVNHISNSMVRSAPSPEKVYPELLAFLGDAVHGETVIVGHNVTFDMKFLAAELERYGKSADLVYADTCALSRKVLPNLYDHKQDTVARHYGIRNQQSHRAVTDATACGEIMIRMLPELEQDEKILKEAERRANRQAKFEPCDEEKSFCGILAAKAREAALQDEYLCFEKAGKLVHVRSIVPLFSVSLGGKHPYIVAERSTLSRITGDGATLQMPEELKPCSCGEAKLYEDAVRVPMGEDIGTWAEQLLLLTLAENAKKRAELLSDAISHWNTAYEMELYWKAK